MHPSAHICNSKSPNLGLLFCCCFGSDFIFFCLVGEHGFYPSLHTCEKCLIRELKDGLS